MYTSKFDGLTGTVPESPSLETMRSLKGTATQPGSATSRESTFVVQQNSLICARRQSQLRQKLVHEQKAGILKETRHRRIIVTKGTCYLGSRNKQSPAADPAKSSNIRGQAKGPNTREKLDLDYYTTQPQKTYSIAWAVTQAAMMTFPNSLASTKPISSS
ncbi:hypothetical protein CHS0354_005636 [Potamilus streckersoni]|uniref:Uncharacterized protein n=1 Tax=Potamilus streckersoni TaxID=2493646 RepID=A0AAE0S0A6_9BIVA|nr:hypothetical protein CHS0354_005636 [Potamilus streckersoni]